jgi:hypothetical protein
VALDAEVVVEAEPTLNVTPVVSLLAVNCAESVGAKLEVTV